jgi:hypothetical protein
MIARLESSTKVPVPVHDENEFRTESDVEQKWLLPLLTHRSYFAIPSKWIRTKEYMSPTEIDKAAGRRYGYIPDYSIWLGGLPLLIVEAKAPDVAVEAGLREAQLYAAKINRRYPPNVNPIGFVLASNGIEIALSQWDSDTEVLTTFCRELLPASATLHAFRTAVSKTALETRAQSLSSHFQFRTFFSVSNSMGGKTRLLEQLGVNEFAEPLFPTLTRYFGSTSDETPDEVIARAYVASDELGTYEGVLETYLKDRPRSLAGNQLQPIVTTRTTASGLSTELQKFSANPTFYSRVQLIIGSVGAGKSTFVQRYYRFLMSKDAAARTRWAFINFNVMPPTTAHLQDWIAETFIQSFATENKLELYDLKTLEKIFSVELNQFDRGPAKQLKQLNAPVYATKRADLIESLYRNATKLTQCVARHFSGERGLGLVVVFDNVDRRSRDQQLQIFEAAQWFKDITRALVLVNLRDSTFEAHRDEPPLDAFVNAINFYIKPPRFAQVIRKRLELVLEGLPSEVNTQQKYTQESGATIRYPASRLGEFLLNIYLSLFDRRSMHVAAAIEALVAKDVRRALGMFGDIIVSPHVPTSQLTGAALASAEFRIQETRIIRSLMRGRYKYFNGKSTYVRNILGAEIDHNRPSNLIKADVLEYLIRNRKTRIDFSQEGFATGNTIVGQMGRLGYDEEDVLSTLRTLVRWGLVEPESLVLEKLSLEDAVRVHASGFIHMRFFVQRNEYLVGITPDMNFASREVADVMGSTWSSEAGLTDLRFGSKRAILERLLNYIEFEYQRRCRRHAFYEERGAGGLHVLMAMRTAVEHLDKVTGRGKP